MPDARLGKAREHSTNVREADENECHISHSQWLPHQSLPFELTLPKTLSSPTAATPATAATSVTPIRADTPKTLSSPMAATSVTLVQDNTPETSSVVPYSSPGSSGLSLHSLLKHLPGKEREVPEKEHNTCVSATTITWEWNLV